MTKLLDRIKQAAKLLIRLPSIGVASLAYSSAIYLSSLRADLLDISDPWWIVTLGIVLLLSPVYHTFVIRRATASVTGQALALRDLPMESFGDLVVGELLVNVLVVLGAALFLLPGIYMGLRSIYYKQIIVLHKARSLSAVRESFRMTGDPRAVLRMFLFLAVSYCIPLAIDLVLTPAIQALWAHSIAILVSTLFIAWVNVYITLSFNELIEKLQVLEGTEKPA
ncbi:MAG: hypothetical protein V3T03_01620 [Candidatus Bipolaricaulota bacterium]